MSYIRCLSNPEGLYIWDDVCGKIAICDNPKDVSGPNITYVNRRHWRGLLRSWNSYWSPVTYGSLSVEHTKKYKIKLVIREQDRIIKEIVMWEVTWAYIASHV